MFSKRIPSGLNNWLHTNLFVFVGTPFGNDFLLGVRRHVADQYDLGHILRYLQQCILQVKKVQWLASQIWAAQKIWEGAKGEGDFCRFLGLTFCCLACLFICLIMFALTCICSAFLFIPIGPSALVCCSETFIAQKKNTTVQKSWKWQWESENDAKILILGNKLSPDFIPWHENKNTLKHEIDFLHIKGGGVCKIIELSKLSIYIIYRYI